MLVLGSETTPASPATAHSLASRLVEAETAPNGGHVHAISNARIAALVEWNVGFAP